MRRVAILGFGPSRSELPRGWEIWVLGQDEALFAADRAFELHPRAQYLAWRPAGYEERLSEAGIPVFTQRGDEFPGAQRFPLEAIVDDLGFDYFNSSIAYMVAMAVFEGVDALGLWGVDCKADEEYAYQRPNTEFLLGIAAGRGIAVTVPQSSALLKFNGAGLRHEWRNRYGWT